MRKLKTLPMYALLVTFGSTRSVLFLRLLFQFLLITITLSILSSLFLTCIAISLGPATSALEQSSQATGSGCIITTDAVHMKCATSSNSRSCKCPKLNLVILAIHIICFYNHFYLFHGVVFRNEIEENDADNDPDLVQVPLPNENSLFQLIIVQCGKLQLNYQCEPKSTLTKSRIPDEPRITEEHWSHYNQPLEELQLQLVRMITTKMMMLCNGRIQTMKLAVASRLGYYVCFFPSRMKHRYP